MEPSSKVKYALLALLELANHYEQGKLLSIEQVVAERQIPERYLGQLLIELRRCGIVRSQRGVKGGYLLAREPQQIALLEVLDCLEGKQYRQQSNEKESQTLESIIIQEVWEEATAAAIAVLGRYTLQVLCDRRNERQESNPMYFI